MYLMNKVYSYRTVGTIWLGITKEFKRTTVNVNHPSFSRYRGSGTKGNSSLNAPTSLNSLVPQEDIDEIMPVLITHHVANLKINKTTSSVKSLSHFINFVFTFSVGNPTADYWVLATDYDNFAIVYSCFKILTRPQGL